MPKSARPFAALLVASLLWPSGPASAASDRFSTSDDARMPSRCMLVAEDRRRNGSGIELASADISTSLAALEAPAVQFHYAGHATFVMETPGGVRIATDFSGAHGATPLPDVVTMNHAHISHWTPVPDPAIPYVLEGWANQDGTPADHWINVGDALIRNVPTDIRSGPGMEIAGNSIFIFETADLCIGHLGHLHHPLTEAHYAAIGRLDIVMVPVDGGLTLSTEAMASIVQRLQARIVLPMHRRFSPIENFLSRFGDDFDVRFEPTDTIDVSIRSLPRKPTIIVLKGV